MIRTPTCRDPVKAITGTSGWRTNASPTSGPGPGTKFATPGGSPASARIETYFAAITGDWDAGLITTVLPAASAALLIPVRIASGKFQGGMTAVTPRGT